MISQEIINKYYSNKQVMFEIVKCLKSKEVAILGDKRVRCIIASQVKYLELNLNKFQFDRTINNLYYSMANFDWVKMKKELGFICFTFAQTQRKEQMLIFNERASEFIKSYDLGIDFDNHGGENYNKAYADCNKLKSLFDKYEVRYSVKTSGSGFHIEVKHHNLPKSIRETTDIFKKVKNLGELMTDIKLILELDTMDVGEVDNVEIGSFYDIRRIFKVPYTIDYKTGLVAFPLSDVQFDLSKDKEYLISLCDPISVMRINLFNRGILERYGKTEGFDNFLKGEKI